MLDLPENELFSAYIDGELTADEQAQVEQILHDNAEARQLVDELRSLSQSLQALPAYKLDEDLAARVLRQAEQEMLGQPPASPVTPLPKFHHVDVPEDQPASWARRLLRPRNFAWSAAAIAVAVLLMLNESGTAPDGNGEIAQGPVTIKPLDIEPTIEAVEVPSAKTVVQGTAPVEPIPDEATPGVPEIAPSPEPTMVVETVPDESRETGPEAKDPEGEVNALLVLQCQLAEGRIGHEALLKLLKDAGVGMEEPIAANGGPIELTLTANQLRQVVSVLQDGNEDFTGVTFPSTPEKAGPRIPSSYSPGGEHDKEATAAGENAGKKSGEATYHVQGTITLRPKATAAASPAETTSAGAPSAKATVTAKTRIVKTPNNLSIKDNGTYRVRFQLKPAAKAIEKTSPDGK